MRPELDLLDQLDGSDETLNFAWRVYGGENNPDALARARRAIALQVESGALQLLSAQNGERVLPAWEVRQVLADDTNWRASGETRYVLRLTGHGAKLV